MTHVHFRDINVPRPDYDEVAQRYGVFQQQWDAADSADACASVIRAWDTLNRELQTWLSLTDLRFNQDTENEEYIREREYSDELRPKLVELAVDLQRKLVASPHRSELAETFGSQAFDLWDADVLAFESLIKDDMVRDNKLQAEYNALLASARIDFNGEAHNLAGMTPFRVAPERQTRYDATRAQWEWVAQHGEQLDRIYDDQVRLRHEMARKLNYDNYIDLGYKRMKRIDYGQQDVDRFRAAVRQEVVPLGLELTKQQAATLGIDRLMHWDSGVFDPSGNPKPQGDHDWMIERATEMFDAMGGGLGEFFRVMVDCDLMDLKNRDTKAGGGFCTDFPSVGLTYIFANFNGTKGDVEVFTHEIGHAFQGYSSRDLPLYDYFFPTYEACEIHSMGLEYLTWPHMEKFFGNDAERFRRTHLTESLLFLPYGVAIDHFQHLVYAEPTATPADRHEMWREMERTYLPWRDVGDLPHLSKGGQWQLQRHIYLDPFYYIDYTLALTCALQFWVRSRADFAGAMEDYVALCKRGGEAPFQELARSAGLRSPFEDGCLSEVVAQAREFLQV